jgi:uncharacterized protein YuzB (UPF0349 family)
MEIIVCKTGMGRHAPTLPEQLVDTGATLDTVECFDRCDTCERFLIARIDGATTRFRCAGDLLAAIETLRSEG